ncbi:MAG TPA: HAMP domain-containing sensor histidine kinase [Anaerolinea sp.]|nr:HAMP domain-containing sensor histidine kinase [Anaerolinea sp.]
MLEHELLHTIHPIWLTRATQSMAKAANIREDLRAQLDQFFSLLEEAVETGDSAWLDPVLNTWAASLTQSDLEANQSNLLEFLREIMIITNDVCRQTLDSDQSLELITALIPHFAYCFDRAAFSEMQVRVSYVSNQLKQVQQSLEKLDRSKSDFIAVAAHELKTPLTLVEGYAAMLRDATDGRSLSPYEVELLEGIATGTRRLKGIIDDMIDVSLIDNNLLSLNFQPVWLNRLFSVLENELSATIRERGQTLEIHSFPGSSEMTFGDPERMLQVFRNVITNAVKYTPDGGKIVLDGRKLPGFIEVVIHDTGIGIAPEDQVLIFDKFARLGNSNLHSSGKTKFKGGGPGLGLHIARGIVESHGGAIWVESPGYDEDKMPGSTFHVLFPLRYEPPDDKMARLLAPLAKTV